MEKQITITVDNRKYFVKLDIKILTYLAVKEPRPDMIKNKEHYDYEIKKSITHNIENIFDSMT